MGYSCDRTGPRGEAIARIRRQAAEEGATDVGNYLMWLEDRLYEALHRPDKPETPPSPRPAARCCLPSG